MRSIRDSREPPYRGAADRWDAGAAGALVTTEFFGAVAPPPEPLPGGAFWVWTTSGWQKRFPLVWIQGAWHQRIARVWKDGAWLPINPGVTPPEA